MQEIGGFDAADASGFVLGLSLARVAARPDDLSQIPLIVVDDVCAPTVLCDRLYPFDSLVVFVTAGADTTGWYGFEVTGLKDDAPTNAKPKQDQGWPQHIVDLVTANLP